VTLFDVIKKLNCYSVLMYDGEEYPDELAEIVISDGYVESTRFIAKAICDMTRVSSRYVVIYWKHLLTMTRVREKNGVYNNIYCTVEMRRLCGEHKLKIKEKIPMEKNGEEIWIMRKLE